MTQTFDNRDAAILTERVARFNERPADVPRDGDFIRFADGTERRVSHIWQEESGEPRSVQTSDGGSWYLGNGYVSFSGGLYTGVPSDTLTPSSDTREGSVWFFHHDQHQAHNGVHTRTTFRVFDCSLTAPAV